MGYFLQGMNFNIAGRVVSNYCWVEFIQKDAEAHNQQLFILRFGYFGNLCVGWDLKQLLIEGFTGVRGKVACKPAKHFRSALGQIVNFFTLCKDRQGLKRFQALTLTSSVH